jgi:hypothetical protein
VETVFVAKAYVRMQTRKSLGAIEEMTERDRGTDTVQPLMETVLFVEEQTRTQTREPLRAIEEMIAKERGAY